jgi:hypothetical protein
MILGTKLLVNSFGNVKFSLPIFSRKLDKSTWIHSSLQLIQRSMYAFLDFVLRWIDVHLVGVKQWKCVFLNPKR